MVSSIRLSDSLKSKAIAYAQELGISLNALIAVSLNDYLDRRLAIPSETPQNVFKASVEKNNRVTSSLQEKHLVEVVNTPVAPMTSSSLPSKASALSANPPKSQSPHPRKKKKRR